jgi:pyruvate,orthophosphate dikinase
VGTPGAATGNTALNIAQAEDHIRRDEAFILALPETGPEHMRYVDAAAGIITFQGGITSHAAIIARQKGKPAIIGAGELDLQPGQEISLDGSAGIIVDGILPINPPDPQNADLQEILSVADSITSNLTQKIKVKANTDTPEGARKARDLGAQGIGVVRTEHMFFAEQQLPIMQAMLITNDREKCRELADLLMQGQKDDFQGILNEMAGYPVTIRLLDAPLHEFMPSDQHTAEETEQQADLLGITVTELETRADAFKESNPMLGNRAIRMGIMRPEIYEMQVRAILEGAVELQQAGIDAQPQIMLPLISEVGEVELLKENIERIASEITEQTGYAPTYKFGIMIETPAAALAAEKLAKHVDFFSFGTNDLTQTTLGLSRDDTVDVIQQYLELGIYQADPFQTIHPQVRYLIEHAAIQGKQSNPDLEVTICGEHGGDPASIRLCQGLIDGVSVSPPRIPVARLVYAQALIAEEERLFSMQSDRLRTYD